MGVRKYFWTELAVEDLPDEPAYAWECDYFSPILMRVFPVWKSDDPLGILRSPAYWSCDGKSGRKWCAYAYTTYRVRVGSGQEQLVHQPLGYCTVLRTRAGAESVAKQIAKAYTEYWPMIRRAWARGLHTEWREVSFGRREGRQLLIEDEPDEPRTSEEPGRDEENEDGKVLGNYLRDLVSRTVDDPWT